MNSRKVSGILAAILGFLTIFTAIYTVVTRGNAGASVILMATTLGILAYAEAEKTQLCSARNEP